MWNRKRVNKGMKRTNSLPLSPVVLKRPYRENSYLQVLRSTVALNSYLGFSALCEIFFGLHVTLTREATLCSNILNAIRIFASLRTQTRFRLSLGFAENIFARISKFRCFHETKQTQNERERFFYNLAEFVFEYLHDSRRILTSFAKFFLKSPFATWSYRLTGTGSVIQRALKLFISRTCFLTRQIVSKSTCGRWRGLERALDDATFRHLKLRSQSS